ncbi:MAG: cobalamin B12-binding domain-containing protein, partial [Pseudomonadota bacterium]
FVDVALGVGQLQALMRFVSIALDRPELPGISARSIIIGTAPGETHVFGASMAAEFFRRAGWDVETALAGGPETLARAVAARPVDVVGIALNSRDSEPALTETIATLRARSVNRRMLVILGGGVPVEDPAVLLRVGADATLAALQFAPGRAGQLVARRGMQPDV